MESRKARPQVPVLDPSSSSDTSRLTPHPSPSYYKGRFAPSPTGPLHFGSMVTALGSYLDARAHAGEWLLRIEDLDPPREQPGAADAILSALDAYGLHWDGPVLYQHTRLDAYEAAMGRLLAAGLAYPCACSRQEIADSGMHGLEGAVYPGTCRNGPRNGRPARTLRLRIPPEEILAVQDEIQGINRQHLAKEIGDFVIRRADGYCSYQLAVVVDDAFQGVTHVVRGADLLLSTARQVYLSRLLDGPKYIYMHLPVAVNTAGEKLSKQAHAAPVYADSAPELLFRALEFLGQSPPGELCAALPAELLGWAVGHWQPQPLRGLQTRKVTQEFTLI